MIELTQGRGLNVLTHPSFKWKDLNGGVGGGRGQGLRRGTSDSITIALITICNYTTV